MSKLAALLTRRQLAIAPSPAGGIPPMPKMSRERLWVRCVDEMRIPRGSEETCMATPNPKKAVLQCAAADSYSKAGAEMKQAEPPLAKPDASISKPHKASQPDDNGRKSR